MSADAYLREILKKYEVNTAGAENAGQHIYPLLVDWGNGYLLSASFSGSLAKGTGVSLGTDADIFLSLSSGLSDTLVQIYESLFKTMEGAGYRPRRQNVSIGVKVNGYAIDLVPARRQSQYGNDHSLYKSKTNSWTQTNVDTHINAVKNSGRIEEIRILKIWRALNNLELPSFLLELAVIDALHNAQRGNLAANVWKVFEHLRDNIERVRYIDPANSNNIISDDLTRAEKAAVAACASTALAQPTWNKIVW